MATVPRTTGPQVAPTAAPNVRLQNTNTAELTTIGARQMQGLGQAIGQAGSAVQYAGAVQDQRRNEEIERANALRVDDALNQAQERAIRLVNDQKDGYTTQTGYAALSRESGMPLAEEYTQRLDKDLSEISGTLGNDRQKQMFTMRSNNLRTQFLGDALRYENGQRKTYELSVRDATVKNAADTLVISSTNPETVAQQETRIRSAIEGGRDPDSNVWIPGSAQMQGQSAAWAKEKADEAVSGAHTAAVQSFMERGDMNGAMAYRKRYGSRMTAADMIKIDGNLQKNYDTMLGASIGNQIATGAMRQPSDMDRLASIVGPVDMGKLNGVVMGIESRGRDFGPDGKILTSPKGAQGRMQVMPGTQADPGFGVRPAADNSPEEIARVGRDYLAAMVKRYDGDVAKAAAAYNWGPGAVDKAVKSAQENAGKGEAVPRDAWLASAPAETRNYVASVMQQMGNPKAGVPERPTLEQMQQMARERLGPNASPLAVKSAVDTITQQFTAHEKAITQRKDELVAKGYAELTQNGGRFSDLSPSLRAALMRDAPDKVDELQNFGVRYAKGDDVTDDRLYLRLASNPQAMAGMTDAQFYALRGGLSQSDFQYFTKLRADALSGKTGETSGDLNTSAVGRFTSSRLQGMGIDPTPKDGSSDAQRVGAIRRFVDSSLLDAQRTAGKKFSDAEVQQHVDGLFAQNQQFRTSFLGISTGTDSRQLLGMKYGDIPRDERKLIERAFASQGNNKPSEADVLGAYFAGKTQARRATGTN